MYKSSSSGLAQLRPLLHSRPFLAMFPFRQGPSILGGFGVSPIKARVLPHKLLHSPAKNRKYSCSHYSRILGLKFILKEWKAMGPEKYNGMYLHCLSSILRCHLASFFPHRVVRNQVYSRTVISCGGVVPFRCLFKVCIQYLNHMLLHNTNLKVAPWSCIASAASCRFLAMLLQDLYNLLAY